MTATEAEQKETPLESHPASHEHEHPSDRKYVVIAIILAVITGAEVGTYFWEDIFASEPTTTLLVATLFPMMVAKFAIVCGWFMHLRFDNPIFRRVFVFGLVLAIAVYSIALLAMQFFSEDWTEEQDRPGVVVEEPA